jgi:type VI secretion system secreted protein Hcp
VVLPGIRRIAVLGVIAGCLVGAASAGAATDMFMIVSGVKGESTDDRYGGSSPLKTLDLGFRRPEGAGRSVFDPVTVTKNVDSTSPFMFERAGTGAQITAIRIVVRSQATTPRAFLQYCLKDVVVTNDHVSNNVTGTPQEKIEFDPDKLEVRYTYQRPNGTSPAPVLAGWNIVSNASIGFTATCAGTGN